MTAVLGLDVACAATGVCLPTGRTLCWRGGGTDVGPRLVALATKLAVVIRQYRPVCAVIEDYFVGESRRTALRLGEVGGVARCVLTVHGVAWVSPTPSQLKRYATGRGNADKAAMVAAARAAGAAITDGAHAHDEADAWLLRALGVLALDRVDLLDGTGDADARHQVVAALTWPAVARG